jgi:hypothetical protein
VRPRAQVTGVLAVGGGLVEGARLLYRTAVLPILAELMRVAPRHRDTRTQGLKIDQPEIVTWQSTAVLVTWRYYR